MLSQNPCLPKTLNTNSSLQSTFLPKFTNPFHKSTISPFLNSSRPPKLIKIQSLYTNPNFTFTSQNGLNTTRRDVSLCAGRSKKKPGGPSSGRIEGNAELRRQVKQNARRKNKKLAESLFYRLKNPNGNYPDNFSEDELQMIGLGYDRLVRFMDKDDPNLKHPYDWYKYGEFGPYSWRGVVLGDPIRGGMSDECVTLIGEVRDHEEWEKIEQHDMAVDFGKRLSDMDKSAGFRYFWVFVRHPKWRVNELPWQQWTLVCEVVVEAGKQRLDKWNLMGRLGNKTRSLITKCAAWMRPDIIYVKKPVYQCRFEPQDDFFGAMVPLLDPKMEREFLCELEDDDGNIGMYPFYDGLCKIVKVNKKAFVDDVVKAYEKLSDEKKSKCWEFILGNHPKELLHPYTKEWKAKLEEMELGCDAPDDEDDSRSRTTEVFDWIEDDGVDDGDEGEDDDDGDESEDDNQEDIVIDVEGSGDDGIGPEEDDEEVSTDDDEDLSPEEDEKFWDEEFNKAVYSSEAMEKLVTRSVKSSTKLYEGMAKSMEEKEQKGTSTKMYEEMAKSMEEKEQKGTSEDGDEFTMRGTRAKVSPDEWKRVGYGPRMKKIKKSRIPPELFLRAAVRPFTYRNLLKEIVLTRHAIVEGEIGPKK
ncbi:hypothetical protein POM88_017429 [Heracleum sosnowskyi]|uniref:Uncharacterized protein n=1 Tax=Heracleum sosnowskyi TaxID=360622 RepID=A0AAD8MY36_9APIA|nr:hypothetical protein POM88_017429 [Heracleum sosnowskyi]